MSIGSTVETRSTDTRAPERQPSASSGSSSGAVQLKRAIAGRSIGDQIQMLAPRDGAPSTDQVHAAAAHGVSGGGGALPHLAQIQNSFGGHDVGNVQAHVGGRAAEASAAMGAEAYASGSSVAFADSPDLHTAAHEAAHIVQQRAGVQLSGGVGSVGDSYEQNADAVADRVVRGESATDLLPKTGGGGAGVQQKAVQRFAGNLDNATTHQGEGTVREQVAENHADSAAATRDSNENPALKVEFETLLGRALIRAQTFYRPVVENVSFGIYRYLQAKAEALHQNEQQVLEQAFASMSAMFGDKAPNVFYGRIVDSLGDGQEYNAKMMELVSGGAGTVQNHMLAHQCFLDNVLDAKGNGDAHTGAANTYFDNMRKKAAESTEKGDKQLRGATNPNLKHLRKNPGEDQFGEEGKGVNGMHARGRLDAKKGGVEGFNQTPKKGAPGLDATKTEALPAGVRYDARISDNTRRSQGSTGITAEENKGALPELTEQDKQLGLGQEHSRGIEQYTLDESQKFIQEARVKYNMPMAAGISGTTTDLHEVAKMMGVTGEEAEFQYQLACLAHLSTAGAHSFHEIMAAASLNTSVHYEPGNYRSILRFGLGAVGEIKDLFNDDRYAQVPGIGDPATLGGKPNEAPPGS